MKNDLEVRRFGPCFPMIRRLVAAVAVVALVAACGTMGERQPRSTTRDRTIVGAGVGAVVGAAGAVIAGRDEADEILAGAAIGAVVGGGVGAYMDAQEEKLARIPGTTVERVSDDTLLIHFDSDILFDTDSAALRGSSQSTLSEVAAVIQEYPKTAVVIQGHTDSRGSEAHNEALSGRRARSVENYLSLRGVDGVRMTTMAM
ncbi:MAG TPA: OmpA family protein, partial [Acidimicrobiia bacterium]|nr:OmpA family protein [Acidimicrobiia bacterium]